MATLNAKQSRQLYRFQSTENFANKNSSRYAALIPFVKGISQLAANNKQITSLTSVRSANGKAATGIKKALKNAIASGVNDICSLVIPYAMDTNDNKLLSAVNFNTSDVITLRDAEVLGFVNTLTGVVTPLLSRPGFADYAVTAAQLSALTKDANSFNDSLGDNKMAHKKSSLASASINTLISANTHIIAKLCRLLHYFQNTDPGFVEGFRAATAAINTGTHHSGIRGIVLNSFSEQPIENATIEFVSKKVKKTTKTGEDGAWQIINCYTGEWQLTITAPNCKSGVADVTIIRGKILEFNITLQPQGTATATA